MNMIESYYNINSISLVEMQNILDGERVENKAAINVKNWIQNGLLSVGKLKGFVFELESIEGAKSGY